MRSANCKMVNFHFLPVPINAVPAVLRICDTRSACTVHIRTSLYVLIRDVNERGRSLIWNLPILINTKSACYPNVTIIFSFPLTKFVHIGAGSMSLNWNRCWTLYCRIRIVGRRSCTFIRQRPIFTDILEYQFWISFLHLEESTLTLISI